MSSPEDDSSPGPDTDSSSATGGVAAAGAATACARTWRRRLCCTRRRRRRTGRGCIFARFRLLDGVQSAPPSAPIGRRIALRTDEEGAAPLRPPPGRMAARRRTRPGGKVALEAARRRGEDLDRCLSMLGPPCLDTRPTAYGRPTGHDIPFYVAYGDFATERHPRASGLPRPVESGYPE